MKISCLQDERFLNLKLINCEQQRDGSSAFAKTEYKGGAWHEKTGNYY